MGISNKRSDIMNLKAIHKSKAIDCYKVGKMALDKGMIYPAYLMLKESTRATLTYINEDIQNKTYSTKTTFSTLLNELPSELLKDEYTDIFKVFEVYDKKGIESIMCMNEDILYDVETLTKKLISVYLREDI